MPPPESIGYTYASDPDTPRFLTTWSELREVLGEVGTHEDRAVVRFFHQVGERRIAVEALGSARRTQAKSAASLRALADALAERLPEPAPEVPSPVR